jgi:tRNA A-37 threonylcarbamoyl transferase component Bud32
VNSGGARKTEHSFAGTARFRILKRIGAGGMGVVYQCFDKERNEVVALKTLRRIDGQAIYRLKQEFRALANVGHRNLVALHELMSVDDTWFITMEFVDGKTFLDHLNLAGDAVTPMFVDETISVAGDTLTSPLQRKAQAVPPSLLPPTLTQQHLERLRDAVRQLAEGVHALHHAGKLHRDIKPSNALVTKEGRVVLLDFGLVTELAPRRKEKDVVGTAAYMAPEQAAGQGATDASDWYAVGSVLYEALTGRVPFEGNIVDVMLAKQQHEALPPRELNHDVPADLDRLCRELLRRDPAGRPRGPDILRLLGVHISGVHAAPQGTSSGASEASLADEPALVGRREQLRALHQAFAATTEGRAVTVYVRGRSGMGKTALVARFLAEIERDERALVLEGRCYERESVPYKALDSLIDALTAHLCTQKRADVEAVLPRHVDALARVFPVLERVDAIAFAPRRNLDELEPRELRQRAFTALRELFARMADRAPLCLHIDDLQWSDQDSAALLSSLVAPPDPPSLLLVCSQREEGNVSLHPMSAPATRGGRGPDVRTVAVEPLDRDEARALASELLGPQHASDADVVASEANGNPFFVHELARYYRELLPRPSGARERVRLSDVVSARFHRLGAGPRRLLELVAVAGRPIGEGLARRAAELGEEEHAALAILRAGNWVRATDDEHIETFHDHIREALMPLLAPAELAGHHRRLAVALEAAQLHDVEALTTHWAGAGDRARAAGYALRGAELADQALAFDRAATLYQLALDLRDDHDGDGARQIWAKLGAAQANAGRGADAARSFQRAAAGAPPKEALALRQRAAGQLLMTGHIEAGLQTMRELLATQGIGFPATARRALLSLLHRRLVLRLRGLAFKERKERDVPAEELSRVDLCWAVAVGLGPVDSIRGADFQTLQVLLALRAGEPYRVARALAVEAGFVAMPGKKGQARAARLLAVARKLTEAVEHPHAEGVTALMTGTAEYLVGHWRRGFESCQLAETIFRDRCIGVAWELTSAQRFGLSSLLYLGEVKDLALRVPKLLAAALDHGNLYGATDLRTRFALVWLAADDVDGARARVAEALASWTRAGFHLQHFNALQAEVQIALYAGDGALAWQKVQAAWPELRASMLMRIQVLRVEAHFLRARAALAALAAGEPAARLVATARADARTIALERMPWATPLAQLIVAALDVHDGERARATQLTDDAAVGFGACEMALHAAVARQRHGELTGSADEQRTAGAWMTAQDVRRPERVTAMIAPGFRA